MSPSRNRRDSAPAAPETQPAQPARPAEVILIHVERLEVRSMMIDMLGEAELSTLRESLKGTEHKEKLDKKAEKILNYYKKEMENGGLVSVKTVVREGIPSDEILKVAQEENVHLIITGCNGKTGLNRLITGCVSKDVEKNARVPVLVAKQTGDEASGWSKAPVTA
jgi:nucleotide-binding universal stress UspA family protein